MRVIVLNGSCSYCQSVLIRFRHYVHLTIKVHKFHSPCLCAFFFDDSIVIWRYSIQIRLEVLQKRWPFWFYSFQDHLAICWKLIWLSTRTMHRSCTSFTSLLTTLNNNLLRSCCGLWFDFLKLNLILNLSWKAIRYVRHGSDYLIYWNKLTVWTTVASCQFGRVRRMLFVIINVGIFDNFLSCSLRLVNVHILVALRLLCAPRSWSA